MPPDVQSYEAMMPVPLDLPVDNGQSLKEKGQYAVSLRENPILTDAQLALKEQLIERKRDLEERLREKGFVLKKATKRREAAGVKLYGLQKTLATLQMSLTSANEHLAATNLGHLKADEELSHFKKQHNEKTTELSFLKEKWEKSKQELNGLGEALKQIERHNEMLKNDIAVSRRVTYATEEDIIKAEKEKKDQDFLIVHLEQQVKGHLEKKALIQAKITAQQRERQVARDALTEAEIEMESIKSEKNQIMMQWKSSLNVLARCDEALQALQDAIDKQKEQKIAIQGEKHSLRKAIRKEHAKVEQQVGTLSSIDNHIRVTQRKIQQIVAARLKLLEQYTKILVSVQDIEANIEKVTKEIAIIQAEKQGIEKEILKESQDLINLEDEMIKSLGDQVTLERSHQKLVHEILSTRQKAKKEDMVVTELEFELAQIRNDILKVQSYNQSVCDSLCALESEISQKLLIVSKLEAEIKRKRSEVDVKTKEIDRLNKQYDKLTAHFVRKDFTPWDHMIANITYEISAKVKASTQLQKQWLAMQSDLVNLTSENNNLSAKTQKLESEKLSLVQRNGRLQRELGMLTENIKDLDDSMRLKHNMITRLNDLIAKNTTLQEFLENENYNIQASNVFALKDMEHRLIKLEICLRNTLKEKGEVGQEVCELQYHIKLWTKKIAFEKETQDTVMKAIMSPMAMTAALKKELERLRLKLENLNCTKERMLSGVERRVLNRKAILVKVKAINQKKESGGVNSEENMNLKVIADLRRQIREANKSTDTLTGKLTALEEEKDVLRKQITDFEQSISQMTNQQELLRLKFKEAASLKIHHLLATALQQRVVKRHCDFRANKWKVKIKLTLEAELTESLRKCVVLNELVQAFMRDLPELQPKLDTISIQLDLAIRLS